MKVFLHRSFLTVLEKYLSSFGLSTLLITLVIVDVGLSYVAASSSSSNVHSSLNLSTNPLVQVPDQSDDFLYASGKVDALD